MADTVKIEGGSTYATIGAAVTAASTGATILVKKATYAETVVFPAGKELIILGCDADWVELPVTLPFFGSGTDRPTINGGDTRRCFTVTNGQTAAASEFSHFIFADGYVSGDTLNGSGGGGIISNSGLTMKDCKWSACHISSTTTSGGGGLAYGNGTIEAGTSLVLEDCEFDGCFAYGTDVATGRVGGALWGVGYDGDDGVKIVGITLTRCIFQNSYVQDPATGWGENFANGMGGAVCLMDGFHVVSMEDVVWIDNYLKSDVSNPVTWDADEVGMGTGLAFYVTENTVAPGTMRNLLFVAPTRKANAENYGWGALAFKESTTNPDEKVFRFDNITITDNDVQNGNGGGLYVVDGGGAGRGVHIVFNNSIIEGNTAVNVPELKNTRGKGQDVFLNNPSDAEMDITLNNCNVAFQTLFQVAPLSVYKYGGDEDWDRKTTCIDVDSQFVGSGDTPYSKKRTSPCIDAGKTISGLDHDIAGNDRPLGGAFDIGAYEDLRTSGNSMGGLWPGPPRVF